MKSPLFILSAFAVLLFASGCETVPESNPPPKTARKAATEQSTAAAREGGAKLGSDAATSSTSKSR